MRAGLRQECALVLLVFLPGINLRRIVDGNGISRSWDFRDSGQLLAGTRQ